jgi:DNA-binding MarR family transcriptional regulator/GNAT superfamily N-acetyltransferase
MADTQVASCIEAVRRFSRFYTRQIGVLHEKLLDSPFALPEARIIYELAHHERTTATELGAELDLDLGYLSRILKGLEQRGLIERRPSASDGRQSIVSLTEEGQAGFALINTRSREQIAALLGRLSNADQDRLVEAIRLVEALLGAQLPRKVPYILRPHQPGDMGWIIHRHGALYAEEYGWDESFEALVATVAAEFLQRFDAKRERCWIAEMEGEVVGSVLLVKHSDEVAKLRLLLVEQKARGLGIGARLVEECLRFARHAGYRRITLWTNSVLDGARRIYERAGFHLVRSEPHRSFGHDLVGETWEREA